MAPLALTDAALAYAFMRVGNSVGTLLLSFWGLWLFPFGMLVNRSGFFPRILGYLLYASGIAYLVTAFVAIVLPEYRSTINPIVMPFYFGELVVVLWLAIVGARDVAPRPSNETILSGA
jgi:predicted transporter